MTSEELVEIRRQANKLAALWPDPVCWGLVEQQRWRLLELVEAQARHIEQLEAEVAILQAATAREEAAA